MEQEKPVWRLRQGSGTHTTKKKQIMRAGDTIECYRHELGGAADKFELVSGSADENGPALAVEFGLKVVHKGGGKYAIVRTDTEEELNDKMMNKREALDTIEKYGFTPEEALQTDSTEEEPVKDVKKDSKTKEPTKGNKDSKTKEVPKEENPCPLADQGVTFGKDFDGYQDCDKCDQADACKAAKGAK